MKRKEGESFADYKKRRELEEGSTQIKLRPKTFWPSRRLGTYRKDGKLDPRKMPTIDNSLGDDAGVAGSGGDTEGRVDKADLGGDGGDK